ncbi:cytochrome c-550 PedF [Neptuniibacter pectenicola]|jgi:cytochrome c-550 PedF|uniref:cytochrome c-550 PedF n=1 Tax=Neptuniibacter pectenicola TaxID=1806669 RepID=UPI0012E747B7|nr:cytochrome c-550 PedF [Neptuniibacter pectenicola]|tara:strand:- start:6024 stop:6467 length:444 start_codon:yes stop_codon:yes gene_type:complete
MSINKKILGLTTAGMLAAVLSGQAMAHGDVTPQSVDVTGLKMLGEEWLETNPYTPDYENYELAVTIGTSAYTQNCARCHGLDAISGGIAPDLRYLEPGIEGDEWFKYRVINGAVRDGRVYMPKMAETLSQEALWAIRAYLETRATDE